MKNVLKLKRRKGFTIIEMVIALLIIGIITAIAFFGGGQLIASARDARVTSDFRSFDVAIKQMLLENPDLMSSENTDNSETLLNKYLSEELQITSGKSSKKDPWGELYQVSFSTASRDGGSEFYVMVVSGGENVTIVIDALEDDDLGLIVSLKDGNVRSETFGLKSSEFDRTGKKLTGIVVGKASE